MNTAQHMEERLWDYIDGLISPAEKSKIEQLIAADRQWQNKYQELLDVHQLMAGSDLEAPSLRFEKNVMEAISRYHIAPATSSYVNKHIIRGIGAFFLTLIAGLLVYCFGQVKWPSSSPTAPSLPTYNLHLHLDRINWSWLSNSSYIPVLMLIIIILGWVFLDMYLQRRRQQA